MELVAQHCSRGSHRRGSTLIPAALVAALSMAIVAPAQAHEPYIGKAWGNNEFGQLGDGTTEGPEKCGTPPAACSTTAVEVGKLTGVVGVSANGTSSGTGPEGFSLAVLADGTVRAWGYNAKGQLGNGTTTNSDVPVEVSGLSGVTAVAAGAQHSLALLSNGKVMAWGDGESGQLGNGTLTDSHVPVEVSGLSGVTAIAAGNGNGIALLSNGKVMVWGEGDGDLPVEKSGLSEEVVAIAAGAQHSLAVLKDGTVMAWGDNAKGDLGNGNETASEVPVVVCAPAPEACPGSHLGGVTAVSAGSQDSMALLTSGKVEAWGSNDSGQLGDGTFTGPQQCGEVKLACSTTPVEVSGLSTAMSISAGAAHTLALLKSGTIVAWGANKYGELGNGTSAGPEACTISGSCSTKPVAVGNLIGVKGIGGGEESSLAFAPPPPTVSAISPKEGPRSGGTKVTITGTELEEGEVKFGTAKATGVTVSSNGKIIEAVSPPGAGTVDVTVTTPAGTSPTSSADQFTYPQAPAEAHLPEFGRCVKSAPKKGDYVSTHCYAEAEGKGSHNWLSGPSATKFTGTLKEPVLQSTGKSAETITCTSGRTEGEYSSAKALKVTKLVFSGCKQSPAKTPLEADCQGVGAANGEIEGKELSGQLEFLRLGTNPKVGLFLNPAVGSVIASFECGGANEVTGKGSGTGTLRELEGSMEGNVGKLNTMVGENTVSYEAAHESLTTRVGVEKTVEATTLKTLETVKNPEPLEVRDKICNSQGTMCMT